MIDTITNHLDLLCFVAGMVVEYFGAKIAKRIEALHPGQTLETDLVNKIEAIVDAKLAAKATTVPLASATATVATTKTA